MPTEPIKNFPSVSEIENYIDQKPDRPPQRANWSRWAITVLALLAVGLTLRLLLPQGAAANLAPKGSIAGTVFNNKSTPVPADIYILKTDLMIKADPSGSFNLHNIPAGSQQLMVIYDGMGYAIPVTVVAGKTVQVGKILVDSTATAPVTNGN